MVQKGYKNLALPEEMVKAIEGFIQGNAEFGYKTVAEFVKDCVRRRLEEIKEKGWIK